MSLKLELIAAAMTALMVVPPTAFAANHREAPITALDRLADITDFFSFVSYDDPGKVTFILNVDPLLDPANGPNYFPFDPNILYEIKIDNNNDALADITFQFRFTTTIRPPSGLPAKIAAGIYTTPHWKQHFDHCSTQCANRLRTWHSDCAPRSFCPGWPRFRGDHYSAELHRDDGRWPW